LPYSPVQHSAGSVLLQPLPYRDPGWLVSLFEHQTRPVGAGYSNYLPVDAGSFAEWKKATQGVAQMAIISTRHQYVSAEAGKLPEKVDAAWCSGNFFSVLGIAAVAGLLIASASLACLVPAWRASRLDPMQALRTE
jgi:hypothetical protein